MDVERLMKDKAVEELETIQRNLQTEMESKKEELRDMVGRRYRDVIDASTEVRRVRALADQLAFNVGLARNTQASADSRPVHRGQLIAVQRFIALHKLLPLISDEEGDALTDVFSLLLAEGMHRQLISDNLSNNIQSVATTLTQRIVRSRLRLEIDLETELAELSEADWVTNQLVALAMLKDSCDLHMLLDIFLAARKKFIEDQLNQSISLLSLVTEMKNTLSVVDQLFAQGDLVRATQAISVSGYRPALIDCLVNDQAFSFGKLMTAEIEKINKQQRDRKTGQLLTQKISDKCNLWIDSVCQLAQDTINSICSFYEKPSEIIEFTNALNSILNENWPKICSNTIFYQKLFRTEIIDRFKELIGIELEKLEQSLNSKLATTSSAPYPLFGKRASDFTPLLGVGFSSMLSDVVTAFFADVLKVRELCSSYEKTSMDSKLETLRHSLADSFASIVARLADGYSVSNDRKSNLNRARLCLALIQCDANSVCQVLNRDGDRIAATSKGLHTAIEDALSKYCCDVVEECLSETTLHELIDTCSHPLRALTLATEWERVELPEVGSIEVPICLSPPLHHILFQLSQKLGENSVAHLLSRNVRKRMSIQVSEQLAVVFDTTISRANIAQRTWIQLLFDCRVLNILFPNDSLKKILPSIEKHVDPFDLSLLAPLMATNVRLAAQRSQLLLSSLIMDVLPSKDNQISLTYSKVTDIVPRTEHPQRLSLIPRLDRNPREEISKRLQASKPSRNKLLSNPQAQSNKNGPMFSSLYDKVSGFSFFGN